MLGRRGKAGQGRQRDRPLYMVPMGLYEGPSSAPVINYGMMSSSWAMLLQTRRRQTTDGYHVLDYLLRSFLCLAPSTCLYRPTAKSAIIWPQVQNLEGVCAWFAMNIALESSIGPYHMSIRYQYHALSLRSLDFFDLTDSCFLQETFIQSCVRRKSWARRVILHSM